MQTQKAEVRERIVNAAIDEFAEKGYQDASLRVIAKNAGITVGNIYAYFTNKEALFEYVLMPIVDLTVNMIKDMGSQGTKEHAKEVSTNFAHSFKTHTKEFIIMCHVMNDSKFARYRSETINMIDNAIRINTRLSNDRLRSIIARNVFYGITIIVEDAEFLEESELEYLLFEYLCYSFQVR